MKRMVGLAVVATLGFLPFAATAFASGGAMGGVCLKDGAPRREVGVVVLDSCFRPRTISIEAGQTVVWETDADAPHTVTFESGLDSGQLPPLFAVKFRQSGVYQYFCNYHPGMEGTVRVRGIGIEGEPMEIMPTANLAAARTRAVSAGVATPASTSGVLLLLIGFVLGTIASAALRIATRRAGAAPPR